MTPDAVARETLREPIQGSGLTGIARMAKEASPANEDALRARLIDSGKLKLEHAEPIRRAQSEHNLDFRQAVVKLGIASQADIDKAMSRRMEYPQMTPRDAVLALDMVAALQPSNVAMEALRALRSQLMLRWFELSPRHKALAIVSPERGEGRSFVTGNLAVAFSQLGLHTLVVDADLRSPRQHLLFKLENKMGLSSVLSGSGDLDSVQRIASLADLSVLPSGPSPLNPQELLARPLFSHMLSELALEFDVILVDTPAGRDFADAQTVAARAGGALMVTRTNFTRLKAALELAQNISDAGATVVGSVMNAF